MKSETQTKHDKTVANKLTILIVLWVFDILIMTLLLVYVE